MLSLLSRWYSSVKLRGPRHRRPPGGRPPAAAPQLPFGHACRLAISPSDKNSPVYFRAVAKSPLYLVNAIQFLLGPDVCSSTPGSFARLYCLIHPYVSRRLV